MSDIIRGKYQIVREIARSNDIVFEAIDTTLGRRIAIKELNLAPSVTGTARRERIERFHREARATGKLNHPNIVAVSDYFEENGRYFIVMEFLEGQTLRDVMQMKGVFSLNEGIQVASQILDALGYAHTNKVIHRDIKPDNIFILPGGIAKLADFGIARLGEEPALTSNGQVFGTPSYMSPEQIEGKTIDNRSDLFSMGVLLYEMLTGRKPFVGDSVISITYAIMNAEPPGMSGVPQNVEQVIRRALSKNPLSRQVNAEQLKLDLRNAEANPTSFGNQTGMGRTGMGMNQSLSMQPPVAPAYNPFPPQQNSGYVLQNSQLPAQPYNPNQAQANGLPWQWNSQPQNANSPSVPAMPSIMPNPSNALGGVALPPAYRQPATPIFVLSPGGKTLLWTLFLAVAIGAGVAFGVIAFQRNFNDYEQKASHQQILSHNQIGFDALTRGDFASAEKEFNLALALKPGYADRLVILKNLSIVLVDLGRAEVKNGDRKKAIALYRRAVEASSENAAAHTELAVQLALEGDFSGAKQEREAISVENPASTSQPQGALPSANSSGDSAPYVDPNATLARNQAKANALEAEGDALYKNGQGDVEAAKSKWNDALELCAGTPLHNTLLQKINQATQNSNPGRDPGNEN